jgi:carbon-monoxide dehydrogenase catalytic subunit
MTPDELKRHRASYPTRAQVREATPDPAVRDLLDHAAACGVSTVFDRFDQQKPQCGFGLTGVCCRVCNMGPCKVTPRSPRGTCGADADVIVARNILRWLAGGVSSHGARSREVMLALKAAAEGRLDQPIRGPGKVVAVAKALGLYDESKSIEQLAGAVADALLEDLGRAVPGELRTLAMAPPDRLAVWRGLDILPIGGYHEVFESLHRTGTGTDGDWRNILKQFLRTGLAFSWSSVLGGAIAQDCLYGLPQRSRITTNTGSIEPDYVNVAIHGHSPVLATAVVEAGDEPELLEAARAAGAQGIRFYGICCSGLSTLYRQGEVHPLANAVGAELVLATGALDLWVADVQDVYPGIMEVADCFHTVVVTTNDSARLPGAVALGFDHQHASLGETRSIARDILRRAIANYPMRRAANVHIPSVSAEADIGFSAELISEEFGGAAGLLSALKSGDIRGIVNLVGCNNPKVMYEAAIAEVADALLANDILILTNGCASFPLLKLGYCTPQALDKTGPGLRRALAERQLPPVLHMGECLDNARASGLFRLLADAAGAHLPAMPFAFSSPEWSNEKGVGAALSFRLMGLNSYHCIPAPVTGSANVRHFFEEGTEPLLGSRMVVEPEPARLAQRIVADLAARRHGLGW